MSTISSFQYMYRVSFIIFYYNKKMQNFTPANWRKCVTEQGILCKRPDDDTKVSKHVGM